MNFDTNLMKDLVSIYGPSGDEKPIREFIENEIKDYVDEIEIDSLGNLIARKKGKGKRVMIAAHMDQVGFMVTHIDDNGFLRVTNIGGVSPISSISQQVMFKNGSLGVISAEPMEDISKIKISNLFIDIGVNNKEEAEKFVSIGDICVYKSDYGENENVIFSKCIDNRVSCYIAIKAIKEIENPKNDLYFVFTSQEEVGLRGAKTSAYKINPEVGIAVDITRSGDTPKAKLFAVGLNKGTAIKVKDVSLLTHPGLRKLMIDTAKKNNIPYQLEVLEVGGTDAGSIQLTKGGVPSGVISIPMRYIHTSLEMASKNDILNSLKLLIELLNSDLNFNK